MRFVGLVALLSVSVSAALAQQTAATDTGSSSSLPPQYVADANPSASLPPAGFVGSNGTVPSAAAHTRPFSGLAMGAQVGILGIGFQVATPLASHFNLRGGASFFNYNDALSSDGINYNANLHFRSVETSVDWFPWARSFHISPGALLYNGNQVTANAAVPAGDTFTLNDTTYTSSATDPVRGTGSVKFNKAAPKITVGWGNLLPRSGRHFSVPFEIGFAYVGQPKTVLNLAGNACYNYEGQNYCSDVATNSMIQTNLAAQQQKIANDISPARFFPILSTGFSYSF
jgi:hypothetical protein